MDRKDAESLLDKCMQYNDMLLHPQGCCSTIDLIVLNGLKRQIIAALTTETNQPEGDAIAREIMNIPIAKKTLQDLPCMDSELCYKMGHRDARHAAAEIVTGHWRRVEE